MIKNIIDCHCHLDDDKLFNIRNDVIKVSKENNIKYILNTADTFSSFSKIELLRKENINYSYSVIGIHPEFSSYDDEYFSLAYKYIYQNRKNIKAIGEIGLDYHYSKDEKFILNQKRRFIEQIKIAEDLDLPIVIHARDALNDVYDILKNSSIKKAYLHCYSGSLHQLKEFIKLPVDIKFGIGGVITFKNSRVLKEIVKEIDLNYFLTETDSPYLAPTPFRGQINMPSLLPYIIKEIALIKDDDEDKASEILFNNGVNYYGIK